MQEHCQIEYEEDIMLIPGHGRCAVNKKIIKEPVKLYNGNNNNNNNNSLYISFFRKLEFT